MIYFMDLSLCCIVGSSLCCFYKSVECTWDVRRSYCWFYICNVFEWRQTRHLAETQEENKTVVLVALNWSESVKNVMLCVVASHSIVVESIPFIGKIEVNEMLWGFLRLPRLFFAHCWPVGLLAPRWQVSGASIPSVWPRAALLSRSLQL